MRHIWACTAPRQLDAACRSRTRVYSMFVLLVGVLVLASMSLNISCRPALDKPPAFWAEVARLRAAPGAPKAKQQPLLGMPPPRMAEAASSAPDWPLGNTILFGVPPGSNSEVYSTALQEPGPVPFETTGLSLEAQDRLLMECAKRSYQR